MHPNSVDAAADVPARWDGHVNHIVGIVADAIEERRGLVTGYGAATGTQDSGPQGGFVGQRSGERRIDTPVNATPSSRRHQAVDLASTQPQVHCLPAFYDAALPRQKLIDPVDW